MASKPASIKAVIYDVDGTMVNSEPLHVAAWDQALRGYGQALDNLSEKFRATMAGRKPIAIAEGMLAELNLPVSGEELLRTKSGLFLKMVATDLQGMPGVGESVQRLKAAGYELAIGTSLDRGYIDLVLGRLGLQNAFTVIVTGDQITRGKPHPETYLTVAERLGLAPAECVVLEDTASGIASAKAAGAWCIAVENREAAPQDTSAADLVVQSLDEVTAGTILKLTRQPLNDAFTL